jgi:hypothetical protein
MIVKSQSVELLDFNIQRNYEKNCDTIKICIDSVNCLNNTLSLDLHIKNNLIYKPERTLSYEFNTDTLFIEYYSKAVEKDSIVYNALTEEYDTLKYITQSVSINDMIHAGCKKYYFKFIGYNKKPKIIYNEVLVPDCPLTYLSYKIYKSDTINIINYNGYKEGKWIDFYDTGEILKVKKYSNNQFLEGYMYDKSGKVTHVVSEEADEVAIPIDFYNETHK